MKLTSKRNDGIEIVINVRANNLTRLYYKQEFGTELDTDLNGILGHEINAVKSILGKVSSDKMQRAVSLLNSKNEEMKIRGFAMLTEAGIDVNELLSVAGNNKLGTTKFPSFDSIKVIWAMHKTYVAVVEKSNKFNSFEDWLLEYADFDVNDCAEGFEKEIRGGLFRNYNGAGK